MAMAKNWRLPPFADQEIESLLGKRYAGHRRIAGGDERKTACFGARCLKRSALFMTGLTLYPADHPLHYGSAADGQGSSQRRDRGCQQDRRLSLTKAILPCS